MKKIIFFLLLSVGISSVSCYDDSGQFVEQMQTDELITMGLRACLKTAVDTAAAHLCVNNGFSSYSAAKYAIKLPSSAAAIRDTLTAHGEAWLIDSLLAKANRVAESLGTPMKTNFSATITGMTFSNPEQVLRGADDAATAALKLNYDAALKTAVAQNIASQFAVKGVSAAWSKVLTAYAKYNATPVSIDFQQHVTNQIFEAFYTEIKIEEANIRHIPAHRISDILKTTFAVLD